MDGGPETLSRLEDVARAAAERAMQYRYKVWGFGEDIALRGLYQLGRVLPEPRFTSFVTDLLRPWAASGAALTNADHVAPGVPLLLLYQDTGDDVFLQAAVRLGQLYASFPRVDGIPVHRPDLVPWQAHIWVDCMYADAPFLVRLGLVTGEPRWIEMGIEHIGAYAVVLQTGAGLFHHGYDTSAKTRSLHAWGRGNGWAMLGLIDTLEVLPRDHPAFSRLHDRLVRQAEALARHQDKTGLWHTIVDDPASPLETSTAAFFAAGIWAGIRLGLLDKGLDGVAQRAFAAALERVAGDGTLTGVSEATPIGDRDNYCRRATGMYPWGQGPLLVAILESGRLGRSLAHEDHAR